MTVPGLSMKAMAEQSNCFIFNVGVVRTFNEEVSCACEVPVDFSGAVLANPLLELLRKMSEETIQIKQTDTHFMVKGKRRQAGVRMERGIELDMTELESPGQWKELNPAFLEALEMVKTCCSKDEQQFVKTCIHMHPERMESMDDFQAARVKIKTGFDKPALLRGRAATAIRQSDVSHLAITPHWIHFGNGQGFVISCVKHVDDFPDLDQIITSTGRPISIPKGLTEAVEIAEVFSKNDIDHNYIHISLATGKVKIRGEGVDGFFSEIRPVKYKGEKMGFRVSPTMLNFVVRHGNKCKIEEGRLKLKNGNFTYVTCLEAEQKKGN